MLPAQKYEQQNHILLSYEQSLVKTKGDRRDLNPHLPESQSGGIANSATATIDFMGVAPNLFINFNTENLF